MQIVWDPSGSKKKEREKEKYKVSTNFDGGVRPSQQQPLQSSLSLLPASPRVAGYIASGQSESVRRCIFAFFKDASARHASVPSIPLPAPACSLTACLDGHSFAANVAQPFKWKRTYYSRRDAAACANPQLHASEEMARYGSLIAYYEGADRVNWNERTLRSRWLL